MNTDQELTALSLDSETGGLERFYMGRICINLKKYFVLKS